MKTVMIWTLALFCVLLLVSPSLSTALSPAPQSAADVAHEKIAPEVSQAAENAAPHEFVPIIITMKKQADLSAVVQGDRDERVRKVVEVLQDTANGSQGSLRAYLATQRAQGNAGHVTRYWVFNGLAVSVNANAIDHLAARKDVARITANTVFQAPSAETGTSSPEPNVTAINAPSLWDLGYRGQGIVVANVDTGVSLGHPDLVAQWRGGENSWFDPNGQHPDTPTDLSGHGTQTMGIMVGGDAGGTAIGVAPDAQWIAVKIFNDQGQATTSGIHAAYQWLLDPDGNPNTADAPHVVNSSWSFGSPGCDLEFQLELQALRAANILPVFSAGNFGPGGATSASPANYPEAFAVGAIDDFDQMYTYSSRGPSSCGEAATIFPELVAPGVQIHTSDRYGTYTDATGTSVAAPHLAGALALLLSVNPQLTADEQANAILAGVFDLGAAGPDDDFGSGRLDVLVAYPNLPSGGPTPTPTAAIHPTPTPVTNVALNQPVAVSSFQDDAHAGSQAVDGAPETYWKTKKAVGKKAPPSEWIVVDLGSSLPIDQVVLEWDANYATGYTIQLSTDNSNWTTVYTTATGDGGNDTITLDSTPARYIKLDSTAWSSGSLRNWLKEFEIYAGGSGGSLPTDTPTPTSPPAPTATPVAPTPTNTPPPAPTNTPIPPTPTNTPPPAPTATPGLPTPTNTPAPPPTATPETGTMHVGDLDGSSSTNRNRWDATVEITVHDVNENPVVGATVSGTWSGEVSGDDSCTTDSSGACSITKNKIKSNVASVTFEVDNVTHASLTYEYTSSANHDIDLDGDSNGTSITVYKP